MTIALAATGCGGEASTGSDPDGATQESSTQDTAGSAATTGPSRGDEADGSTTAARAATSEELFPDVVDATADQQADGTWNISATLSSPYDTPERYADAWRVVGPGGTVFGIRELAHDHAGEQPFTRSLGGVVVPEDVDEVVIEGRDQQSGWGGATFTIRLERG